MCVGGHTNELIGLRGACGVLGVAGFDEVADEEDEDLLCIMPLLEEAWPLVVPWVA